MLETDEALCEAIQQGDMKAFDVLYTRYERPLFGFIMQYIPVREDAEEIFHESFMKVLETPPHTLKDGSLRSWLYRIARNLSLNHIRNHKRRSALLTQHPLPPPPHSQNEWLEHKEMAEAFQQAVVNLPAHLREVYRLRTAGMEYNEISHVLSIPTGTVKSRMHHLVKQLQQAIQPWQTEK